ncbi:hypothetical protein BW723_03930 [Polaribacter reichenbachii]|uniref:Beta-porphyranase A C-terminal domain-containing protein n=1 Tax=Polaribacter reichenbachii TaxID=996801 RepID=A0A1B8TUK0_9FLAO|nr:hypothetical protein [Polaribacter reichenbachii]APZ45498.1 hypothetical protein BW723_03930 [Polaribacter reichenbachii]AUC19359.1 hypothetical protein BTO17_11935 [Polaribacter reichenbachii]OBY63486.1 hypothetical protein LPB301_11775 [Polaribacter reichenbachii]
MQKIEADKVNSFQFKTSELKRGKYGELVIRLGIGREHPKNNSDFVYPEIYFNGTKINVPKDWRGYDQNTRKRFFGVLEIPVPYHLIDNNKTYNKVDITFSNNGGFISSVVLQKFDFTIDLKRTKTPF